MNEVNMDSLVTIAAYVDNLGFTSQFEVNGKTLSSLKTDQHFMPDQIKIIHFYRFEGNSSQDDNSIMYAIETDTNEKGTIVDGYGTASDTSTADFMHAVTDIQK